MKQNMKSNVEFVSTKFLHKGMEVEIRKGFAIFIDGDLRGILPSYEVAEKEVKQLIDDGTWIKRE